MYLILFLLSILRLRKDVYLLKPLVDLSKLNILKSSLRPLIVLNGIDLRDPKVIERGSNDDLNVPSSGFTQALYTVRE